MKPHELELANDLKERIQKRLHEILNSVTKLSYLDGTFKMIVKELADVTRQFMLEHPEFNTGVTAESIRSNPQPGDEAALLLAISENVPSNYEMWCDGYTFRFADPTPQERSARSLRFI